MASITKRQNKWQVRIRLSNYPTVTKTFNKKSHALQWARETEIQIEKGLLTTGYDKAEDNLRVVLERYLSEVTPSKKGHKVEGIRLKKLMRDPIAATKFGYLKPSHLIKYRNQRLKEVSASTVKKELNILSHVFETAIKEWDMPINGNPIRQITKPKENKPRDRRLENDEEERLLLSCSQSRNPYLLPFIIVATETTMRRGELLQLERQHLNLNNRTAYLPMTKNGDSRTVPLSTRAIAALNKIPIHISGKVFPVSETALRGLWNRACRRAGINNLHLHDLRHEGTSRLFELGLNIMEVSTITGHKDLKMLKRYTHLKAQDLALKLG
ncbi:MAG: integrase [Rhodospirillales bacterium]|nr:integrase [Rhodospirillales bacterium]